MLCVRTVYEEYVMAVCVCVCVCTRAQVLEGVPDHPCALLWRPDVMVRSYSGSLAKPSSPFQLHWSVSEFHTQFSPVPPCRCWIYSTHCYFWIYVGAWDTSCGPCACMART